MKNIFNSFGKLLDFEPLVYYNVIKVTEVKKTHTEDLTLTLAIWSNVIAALVLSESVIELIFKIINGKKKPLPSGIENAKGSGSGNGTGKGAKAPSILRPQYTRTP